MLALSLLVLSFCGSFLCLMKWQSHWVPRVPSVVTILLICLIIVSIESNAVSGGQANVPPQSAFGHPMLHNGTLSKTICHQMCKAQAVWWKREAVEILWNCKHPIADPRKNLGRLGVGNAQSCTTVDSSRKLRHVLIPPLPWSSRALYTALFWRSFQECLFDTACQVKTSPKFLALQTRLYLTSWKKDGFLAFDLSSPGAWGFRIYGTALNSLCSPKAEEKFAVILDLLDKGNYPVILAAKLVSSSPMPTSSCPWVTCVLGVQVQLTAGQKICENF